MNEEEKKAIERIEDTFYSDLGKGINKFQKITLYEDSIKDVRIVLNLLEKLQKENEEIRIKNNAIKRESEAYLEYMIRLDNELNLEKEKSKYELIRQNCLSQELVNKLYIPIQKVKDKIEEEKLPLTIVGGRKNKKTLEYGIKLGRRQVLQELIKEREEKYIKAGN